MSAPTAEKGIAERFARETAQHQMTVLHDDGLYRHLRFRATWWQPPLLKQQTSSFYWFDLITIPGALTFQGDGTSYVFSRIADMFEFFRSPVGRVNPGYWSEKLTSTRNGQDGVKVYDEKLFRQHVIEDFVEHARSRGYTTRAGKVVSGGVPRGTGKALREQVLDDPDGMLAFEPDARRIIDEFQHGGHRATCSCGASREFSTELDAKLWDGHTRGLHRVSVERVEGFRFSDTWEWDCSTWDWWFLWACHAIVWGIAQYDAAKAGGAS